MGQDRTSPHRGIDGEVIEAQDGPLAEPGLAVSCNIKLTQRS